MTATKNRRSGREGQPNGKCKCRWGFQENGEWGKVYSTCGKPVDFHLEDKTGRKVWHLTCLECRTQQAKHFGTTLKTAKPVAKVTMKSVDPVKVTTVTKAKPKKVKKLVKKVVKNGKVTKKEMSAKELSVLLQQLTTRLHEMAKTAA